jgi:hypothetical protein
VVILPDAVMVAVWLPTPYLTRHDLNLVAPRMIAFGDEGYGNSHQIKGLHQGIVTPQENTENENMRRPRLCAEWTFGYISNN